MSVLFAQILNMSLTASVVILCVMAVRLLLRKAPKIFSYALWAVVLFRLLCPVSLTVPFAASSEDAHYFVNFHFAPDGSFDYADVTIDLFREDEYTQMEMINSLDPETVAAEINAEYQKAIS